MSLHLSTEYITNEHADSILRNEISRNILQLLQNLQSSQLHTQTKLCSVQSVFFPEKSKQMVIIIGVIEYLTIVLPIIWIDQNDGWQ